ncbi:DUF4232 domain-containing protein [Streptomyces sp. MST-110588]|uniref:DUF4232 domain-containing protein n=1 Tax=Streptomyces sp. MST-110588 TaxID=2833628 RepID=UPI001F5C303A|nr:DUF4232 domain-containing protein [Streptomyces sp. MST-110588]UNO41755.1 DUF4232 domain-containing protein [Streptomyces sp. MST-110588]
MAALTLSVGLVGCDEPRATALRADCTTKNLQWKVTVLKKKPADGIHHRARLTAKNTGSRECSFRGFPKLEVRVGKGPSVSGKGTGTVLPVSVATGSYVSLDLRYDDATRKGGGPEDCSVQNGAAYATAPHDKQVRGIGSIPVVDEKGGPASFNVCSATVRMSPPKRPAAS